MSKWLSPTGSPIVGELLLTPGLAQLTGFGDDGEPEYAGGTEHFYDDQVPVTRDGKQLYADEDGAEWTFDQLIREDRWEPQVDTALEEGTRFERAFGDGADVTE